MPAVRLDAFGQEAVTRHEARLVGLANKVRFLPQAAMFTLDLLLIGVSAINGRRCGLEVGHSAEWSGVPFAVAFALSRQTLSGGL